MAGTGIPTLADTSLLSVVSNLFVMDFVDLSPFPELAAWFDKMKVAVPNYEEANGVGLKQFQDMINSKIEMFNVKK